MTNLIKEFPKDFLVPVRQTVNVVEATGFVLRWKDDWLNIPLFFFSFHF